MNNTSSKEIKEVISWLSEQSLRNVSKWSEITEPLNNDIWTSAEKSLDFITNRANYLKAAQLLPWDVILSQINSNSIVLDLGCGMGWLSAMLSVKESIEKIICVDSDANMLETSLPDMFRLMSGNIEKVQLVCGLFEPILLESSSVDLIVASSSFHHSDNLFELLKECRRVLKRNGILVILGENPINKMDFIISYLRISIKIIINLFVGTVQEKTQQISGIGILYDPVLGDWNYSRDAWYAAIKDAGFRLFEIDSRLHPYSYRYDKMTIKHFICYLSDDFIIPQA